MAIVTADEVSAFLRLGTLSDPDPNANPPTEGSPITLSEVNSLITLAQSKLETKMRTFFDKDSVTQVYETIYGFDSNTRKYVIPVTNQPLIGIETSDKIERWTSNNYTTVPNTEYLVEPETSKIYVRNYGKYRIKYTYGIENASPIMKRLAILMVGIDIYSTSSGESSLPLATDSVILEKQINRWQNEIDSTIKGLARFSVV